MLIDKKQTELNNVWKESQEWAELCEVNLCVVYEICAAAKIAKTKAPVTM